MVVIHLLQKLNKNEQISNEIEENLHNKKAKLMVGEYLIAQRLGSGQFGAVYKGVHQQSKKTVAIKVINITALMNRYEGHPAVQQKLRRYLQTQQLLMKRCHSAFVLKLEQAFENSKCKVLIVQYCNDGGLDAYITKKTAIEEEGAVEILRQMVLGLAELHRNDIIHRDLKPANILIHNGIFKIADFGFSRQMSLSPLIATNCGSGMTKAPQVAQGRPYGLKADIWSLGMIYFMMIFPEGEVNLRYKEALRRIDSPESFNFQTISKEPLSKQSVKFLQQALCRDENTRLDWEQTLDHSIFKVHFQRLPAIYLPGIQKVFQSALHQSSRQQSLRISQQSQMINLQRLREQSQRLIEGQREVELGWRLDIEPLNQQYLQCRISQFILTEIIEPLQKKQLLNLQSRKHVQFIFLLINRCRENMINAKDVISKRYPEQVGDYFNKQIDELWNHINKLFNQFSQHLKQIEGSLFNIVRDTFQKTFQKSYYDERQQFLNKFQRDSFTKDEQIRFTCQNYIVSIINEVSGDRKDEVKIKRLIKAYKQINQITLQLILLSFLQNLQKYIIYLKIIHNQFCKILSLKLFFRSKLF